MIPEFTETSGPAWEPWHEDAACPDSELAILFTVDLPTEDEKTAMRAVCAACPVLSECAATVAENNPGFGFWAGKFLGGEIPVVLLEEPRWRPVVMADMSDPIDWRDEIRTLPAGPMLRLVPAWVPDELADDDPVVKAS